MGDYVGTLGTPMPARVRALWRRVTSKKHTKPPDLTAASPGPRSFSCPADAGHTYHFVCDPDAPLKHLGPVVLRHEGRLLCWAYLKTKHPKKAKVLRVGWPGRSVQGVRVPRRSAGTDLVPITWVGKTTLDPTAIREVGRS
jgi:hypothetical protein